VQVATLQANDRIKEKLQQTSGATASAEASTEQRGKASHPLIQVVCCCFCSLSSTFQLLCVGRRRTVGVVKKL